MGDSVGRWDGDTLVIDTTQSDRRQLAGRRRLVPQLEDARRQSASSRKGDTLTWSATVEDPQRLHQGVGDDAADDAGQCEPEGAARREIRRASSRTARILLPTTTTRR